MKRMEFEMLALARTIVKHTCTKKKKGYLKVFIGGGPLWLVIKYTRTWKYT